MESEESDETDGHVKDHRMEKRCEISDKTASPVEEPIRYESGNEHEQTVQQQNAPIGKGALAEVPINQIPQMAHYQTVYLSVRELFANISNSLHKSNFHRKMYKNA
jgi:hypothetical protein